MGSRFPQRRPEARGAEHALQARYCRLDHDILQNCSDAAKDQASHDGKVKDFRRKNIACAHPDLAINM
jgi:hypothetical protein